MLYEEFEFYYNLEKKIDRDNIEIVERNKGKSLIGLPDDYCVVAVKTNGSEYRYNSIIEIAALKISNGKVIDEFSSIVRPKYHTKYSEDKLRYVDNFTEEVIGITNDMIESAPLFSDICDSFLSFVRDSSIVGYKINYYINLIYDNIYYTNHAEFNNDFFDMLRISRKVFPNLENHKLKTIAKFLGVMYNKTQHGITECMTTYQCIEATKSFIINTNTYIEPSKNKKSKYTVHHSHFENETRTARSTKIDLDDQTIESIRKSFIAFDVETTGFNRTEDRIIEIGAVLFINGKPSKTFSSLVNPYMEIPYSATAVNHITNDMIATAPLEEEIYPEFMKFIGEATNHGIIMCAHNASFDFDFLTNTLSRLGIRADILCIDTLTIAKKYIKGLENYKQCALEKFFNLTNLSSHRASSDAENCGKILCHILDYAYKTLKFDFTTKTEIISHETEKIKQEKKHWGIYAKDITAACVECKKDNAFYQKRVVISGELQSYKRADAYAILKGYGADVHDCITKNTNYLITNSKTTTGKIKKAMEYIERGIDIKIIDEEEFLKLLEEGHGTD